MTPRSPIFWKLFLSASALIAVTVFALDFYLRRFTASREVESVERRLEAQVRIFKEELGGVAPADLGRWARDAHRRGQSRVTVIDPRGTVLADSEHDPRTMENQAGRPEVRDALQGRRGVVVRHRDTRNLDQVYLAAPAACDGKPGYVLRLAVPVQELDAAISAVRRRILMVSLLAAAILLVAAYLISRSLTRRIRRLQSFAEGLVRARFSETLAPEPADELGDLARSLNRMAEQLRELVDRLRLESARREAILSSMVEGVLAVDNELDRKSVV